MIAINPDAFDLAFRLRTGPETLGPEVYGYPVGVFAVILSVWWPPDSEPVDVFAVVHHLSGIHICSCADFVDAMQVADDVSRFSKEQPPLEEAAIDVLLAQLGKDLCNYILESTDPVTSLVTPTPFRVWLRCGS